MTHPSFTVTRVGTIGVVGFSPLTDHDRTVEENHMLRFNERRLQETEALYPGILEQIMRFENATLPECPHCDSENTADVQIGIIGRTTQIAAATTKFTLIPNGPRPGRYYCQNCKQFFGEEDS